VNLGSILNLASQLPARGINVITTRFAHGGDDARIQKDTREGLHPRRWRTVQH
jgi:hypothetical protein